MQFDMRCLRRVLAGDFAAEDELTEHEQLECLQVMTRFLGLLERLMNAGGFNLGLVMRKLTDCRVARDSQSIRDVLISASKPGRRTGAIMLVDDTGVLTGIFTDSDLARLLEGRCETALDSPIRHVMTHSPTTVPSGSLMTLAVGLLVQRKISELPVVNGEGRPVGLVDITDVVAWLPASPDSEETSDPDQHSLPKTVPFPNRSPRHSRK